MSSPVVSKREACSFWSAFCLAVSLTLALADPATAHTLVNDNTYTDGAHCDFHPPQTFVEELGIAGGQTASFPIDERISASSVPAIQTPVCTGGTAGTDYQVTITNLSGRWWYNLWFVADLFSSMGNWDGNIGVGRAFRIDDIGVNQNLLSESMNADLVFEPGETWVFLVEDWQSDKEPHHFDSFGLAAGSFGTDDSRSSIVATLAPQHVAVNKDIRNATGLTANDVEILVEGSYPSAAVRSHFDGGFPSFTITPVGPNTQFRWSGLSVPDGTLKHVGIDLDGPTMKILGVFWTFDGSAIGCVPQVNSFLRTDISGNWKVVYENSVTQCASQALYAGGTLDVEYYVDAPDLADLKPGGVRFPIDIHTLSGPPHPVAPGGQAVDPIPDPPPSALFAVLVYGVGTDPNLAGPETTNDFVLLPLPSPPAAPALPPWGPILLALALLAGGLVAGRRWVSARAGG